MKTNIFNLILTCFILLNSCSKNFDDTNVDPNNPSKVPAEYLFTSGSKYFADLNCGCDQVYFGWLWAQYFSQNNYTDESRFQAREDAISNRWEFYYANSLNDLREVIKITEANPGLNSAVDKNKIALAKILSAMIFQDITDIWGPVPYKEALQGKLNRTPKFDNQNEIYIDLLNVLDTSIAQLNESEESFGSADNIYFGDVRKWKKFANTLRMRIAIRMADADPITARSIIENVYQSAFNSNDDNAYFHYLTGQPNNSTVNQCRVERVDADFGMSNVFIDNTLITLNDARLSVFADEKVNGGGYLGRPYGQNSGNAAGESPDLYSQPSGAAIIRNASGNFKVHDVVKPDAFGRIISYAEVCFILAEGVERGWNIPGTAKEWYDKGVTASLEEWGITDPVVISNYLAQKDVDYSTSAGDWKQKIGVQKWIALFLQGTQGWNEWRRLDFDKLQAPVDGTLKDVGNRVAPTRLTYPINEQTQNATHYYEAVGLLKGPDKLSTRLWWDVK